MNGLETYLREKGREGKQRKQERQPQPNRMTTHKEARDEHKG